jgi:hypothetical protein
MSLRPPRTGELNVRRLGGGSVASPASEIDRRLSAARVSGSPNDLSAAELREWAVEYLGEYDQELARFPRLAGRPHWNLWMIDAALEDALFAVLIFRPDGADFFCGTGDSFDIRRWSENTTSDAAELEAEAAHRFRVAPEALRLSRPSAEAWLGRAW